MRRLIDKIWSDRRSRSALIQILTLLLLVYGGYVAVQHLTMNLAQRDVDLGFGFLKDTAGFNIIFQLISFSEQSTYLDVFWVGLLNTILVSIIGIVLATILGFVIGLSSLSSTKILVFTSRSLIELIRNIPLLLQLFFWYFIVLRNLPYPQDSLHFQDWFFLSNRGLSLPKPIFDSWLSMHWELPVLGRFNFAGGLQVIPEFLALLLALTIYTAAYIAEIVRMGIRALPRGQYDAAKALGFSRWQCYRLVLIPQAMRIITPPLTNQYLNLTKNSSLATAIAYPDLISVFAGTALNQTGQAVEIIVMTMAVYLFISLMISLIMLGYERRLRWST